jgi:hypothetical protein
MAQTLKDSLLRMLLHKSMVRNLVRVQIFISRFLTPCHVLCSTTLLKTFVKLMHLDKLAGNPHVSQKAFGDLQAPASYCTRTQKNSVLLT